VGKKKIEEKGPNWGEPKVRSQEHGGFKIILKNLPGSKRREGKGWPISKNWRNMGKVEKNLKQGEGETDD